MGRRAMKNRVPAVMIALAIIPLGCLAAQVQEPTPEVRTLLEFKAPAETPLVPGEVIVKMKPGSLLSATDLSRLGIEDGKQVTSGGELIYRIAPSVMATLSPAEARNRTLALVQALKAMPDVEYAQPNYILRIADRTPNDPRFPEQWHYRNNGTGPGRSPGGISLPRAWDTSTGSNSVVVAVIDTGILPNHPDIVESPNLIAGYDMISDPKIANDGGGRDNNPTDPGDGVAANECGLGEPAEPSSWHGTHVAGTVGVGKTDNSIGVAGVNWSVRVQAVRVLGKCGGTNVDTNDGIRWAAGLPVPGVPVNPTPARVINMSLGGREPCSMTPATQAAINDVVGSGAG